MLHFHSDITIFFPWNKIKYLRRGEWETGNLWCCLQNVRRIQPLLTTLIVIAMGHTIVISPLNCLLTGLSSSILSPFGLHMEARIKTHIRWWHFSTQNHLSSPCFTGCSLLLCPHLRYSLPHSIPPWCSWDILGTHLPQGLCICRCSELCLHCSLSLSFEICIQIPPTQGFPRWSSGWHATLSMQGAWVWSLVRELDPTCHN